MIIVVEGASAAGKTTWCRKLAADHVLVEGEPAAHPAPAGDSDPDPAHFRAVAAYWTEYNVRRWRAACDLSQRLGWVVCDTDPFKLHWVWTLWVTGRASSDYWQTSRELSRAAFADENLGLPDLVLFADLAPEILRRQKAGDPTRTRRRHELHVSIAQALKCWYLAIAALDTKRVEFRLPADGLQAAYWRLGTRPERTGAALFDRFMSELDRQRP